MMRVSASSFSSIKLLLITRRHIQPFLTKKCFFVYNTLSSVNFMWFASKNLMTDLCSSLKHSISILMAPKQIFLQD